MWPIILIGILIFLIFILLSVCAYPLLCVIIASSSKKYKENAIAILLLLTIAVYFLACTVLEQTFDNWCYSLYAGIAITPATLYIGTGLKEPSKWLDNREKPQHNKITIPMLTFGVSSLLTIEGGLRMAHSYSAHWMLNNVSWVEGRFYYDGFHYAGCLLFFVSIVSAFFIGYSFSSYYIAYSRKLAAEKKEEIRIKEEINRVAQEIKIDFEFLMSSNTQQFHDILNYYENYCEKIITALKYSDEKKSFSVKYTSFSDINMKILLLTNRSHSYYIYPMGIVFRNSKNIYKYIPVTSAIVSIKTERKKRKKPLPKDVKPINIFWLHSCRDGGPDMRFNYNPATYVYEYGILNISELFLHVYRINTAEDVLNAYNKMYSYILQIKEQKYYDKKGVLQEIKEITFNSIGEKGTAATCKQFVEMENPRTLEECFYAIISKRGIDILKDDNIVNFISSSYKEVDISEYKEVLDSMSSENYLYQFIDPNKQNDFALYNLSNSFACERKIDVQKSLFITLALVSAIKKINNKA